jgi:GNAT superfamily N-acetyltransferase
MTVVVRPAHLDELTGVGELTAVAYADEGAAPSVGYLARLRDAVTRAREAELYVALLPDAEGTLAGTVTFCPQGSPWAELAQPDEGELRMLAVAASARRRGVARALVGACVERSRELGYRRLVCSSLPAQRAAHVLYDRLGLRRLPDRDWSPEPGVDLLAFGLDL